MVLEGRVARSSLLQRGKVGVRVGVAAALLSKG